LPSDPKNKSVKLESAKHAIEVGYAAGKAQRDKGVLPVEEGIHMEMWGDPHKNSPYLNWWNKGFEAGFRGTPKPSAR
jgi:hypothetical protein